MPHGHRRTGKVGLTVIHTVSFPGLGLEFTLNRVAFQLFGKDVYWYGVIIACGFLLAVLYCCRKAKFFGVDEEKLLDMLFFAAPASIIGARVYYVIFYLSMFRNADGSFDWGRAVAIWDGGLAIYGGIIAAVITVAIYCKVRGQSFWNYADVGCYGLLIGQAIGRWGNFVNVEAYGGLTTLPWRMCSASIADEMMYKGLLESQEVYQSILDGTVGVHPTFLYESLWNVLGFVLLMLLARKGRKFDGQMFLSYVVWYGVGRAVIEGMRTDSLYFFGTGLRTSQMVGIISAVAAIVIMVIQWKRGKGVTPPLAAAGKEQDEHGN